MHVLNTHVPVTHLPENYYQSELKKRTQVNAELLHDKFDPTYMKDDGGYYIWFKDSAAADVDASHITSEHELLYQGKHYPRRKSKLSLYVTAYSICLVIVITMLIMSPFLSAPLHMNNMLHAESPTSHAKSQLQAKAMGNMDGIPADGHTNDYISNEIPLGPPTMEQYLAELNTTSVNSTSINVPSTDIKPITKLPAILNDTARFTQNSIGITDKLYNVIYVQQNDGGFSVQESSWSNGDAAMNRIKELTSLNIPKTKPYISKAELQDKGIRYRVVVGEFKTLDEAIKAAGKLRKG